MKPYLACAILTACALAPIQLGQGGQGGSTAKSEPIRIREGTPYTVPTGKTLTLDRVWFADGNGGFCPNVTIEYVVRENSLAVANGRFAATLGQNTEALQISVREGSTVEVDDDQDGTTPCDPVTYLAGTLQ